MRHVGDAGEGAIGMTVDWARPENLPGARDDVDRRYVSRIDCLQHALGPGRRAPPGVHTRQPDGGDRDRKHRGQCE